jgi:hypothetical protein
MPTPGPPVPRLLASLAIGVVLAAAYWWAMDQIPAAIDRELTVTEARP